MIPSGLKDLIVPGTIPFLILALIPGVLLLFRRKNGGRAGKIWVTALVLLYWVFSTPITAVALVDLLSPDMPPVMSKADAPGATAIVLLGSGMDVHRSRGDSYEAPTREGALRVLEAARLHRLLGGVPIIATGGMGSSKYSDAGLMAHQLEQIGVPADKIIKEEKSTNTRDHAMFVPALLKEHGIEQFVLVTSQQHIARSLEAFRAVGTNPIPSTPDVYVSLGGSAEMYLPSRVALNASERMMYNLLGWVYYKARGWV
jgi:uncharacterized SAM-binding protein YcdF (DUF218 family)